MWRTGPGRKCKTAWIAVTWRPRSQGASESLVLKITSALCFLRIRYFGERWEETRECWRGVGTAWPLGTLFVNQFYFWSSGSISSIQFYKIIPSERPGNVCNVILIVLFSHNFCEPILLLQFRLISTILILFLAFSSQNYSPNPFPQRPGNVCNVVLIVSFSQRCAAGTQRNFFTSSLSQRLGRSRQEFLAANLIFALAIECSTGIPF